MAATRWSPGRIGWPVTSLAIARWLRSPARTARPPPVRCWPGSWSTGAGPGFLIGGVPEDFGCSARPGDPGGYFVIEADEYDTAFFDKRSKLLHYRAQVAILNNLEFDHADIFADLGAIETQFHHWIRTLPSEGRLIVNGEEQALERVLRRGCWTPVTRFMDPTEWSLGETAVASDGMESFDVLRAGEVVAQAHSPLWGRHNRVNALAALLAAQACGVAPATALEGLSLFRASSGVCSAAALPTVWWSTTTLPTIRPPSPPPWRV